MEEKNGFVAWANRLPLGSLPHIRNRHGNKEQDSPPQRLSKRVLSISDDSGLGLEIERDVEEGVERRRDLAA